MLKIIVLFMVCLSANAEEFIPYVGFAFHDLKHDKPEYTGQNPLGIIGVEITTPDNKTTFFCEHISSIQDTEKGKGLNMCGIKLRLTE